MRILVAGLVTLVAVAACGSGSGSPAESPTTDSSTSSAPAEVPEALSPGSDWILVGPNTADVRLAGRGVTLRFDRDATLSGSAPINTYSGTFTATQAGSLEIGPLTRTEMGGDPDLLAAEDQYFQALSIVDGFDTDGEQLSLRTGDTVVLRYALEDTAAVYGASLVGKTIAKARIAAADEGYEFRVVSVDGQSKPVTMDYRPDRLNATVVDGRVVEVTVG